MADTIEIETTDAALIVEFVEDYCSRNYPPSKGAINIPWSVK